MVASRSGWHYRRNTSAPPKEKESTEGSISWLPKHTTINAAQNSRQRVIGFRLTERGGPGQALHWCGERCFPCAGRYLRDAGFGRPEPASDAVAGKRPVRARRSHYR